MFHARASEPASELSRLASELGCSCDGAAAATGGLEGRGTLGGQMSWTRRPGQREHTSWRPTQGRGCQRWEGDDAFNLGHEAAAARALATASSPSRAAVGAAGDLVTSRTGRAGRRWYARRSIGGRSGQPRPKQPKA
jgi:hypothetical protein